MKRLALGAVLVTLAQLRSASAQPVIEDVRIEYSAPQYCPTEGWVLRRMRARTDRFRRVRDDLRARTFSIDIVESGAGYIGTLGITEPEPKARTTSRRIEAARCVEVADGLALIAALTIDPRAKVDAIAEEAPVEQVPIPEEGGAPVIAPRPARPKEEPLPRTRPAEVEASLYLRFGAGFVGFSGVAPEFLFGGQGFVEGGRIVGRSWFSPALRLSVRHSRHDAITFAEGTAHFRLSTMALDLCPIRAHIPSWELGLCASGELGELEAEGTQTANPQQVQRFWAAGGGLLRASASLGRVGLEASLGAEAPLRRDRFQFNTRIGEVDLVVLFVGLAVTGQLD